MTDPAHATRHWLEQAARTAAASGRRDDPLSAWSGWAFLICAAVAIGHGLWTLYGSGARIAAVDATAAESAPVLLGPIRLEPQMNALRAVLRAAHAPVGSTRLHYEVSMVDAAGRVLWEKHGALGSTDDDASIVRTTTSLGDFRIARPGDFFARVRIADGSMDDLREATLELRRNVAPVDPRVPWGFGLAALVCLIVNVVAGRRRAWPQGFEENDPPTAA